MESERRWIYDANKLIDSKRVSEVIFSLEASVRDELNMLALMNADVGRYESAISYMEMASKIDPGSWTTFNNFAHILNSCDKHVMGEKMARRSCDLSQWSEYIPIFNLAILLAHQRRYHEAIPYYQRTFDLHQTAMNSYNLACALLTTGQLAEGWTHYDSRLDAFDTTREFRSRFHAPDWNGVESLSGKSLLIYSEQGVGDLINFVRFIKDVPVAGSHVILEAQAEIADLLALNFPMVEVISRSHHDYATPPPTDYVASICSLPGLLKIHNLNEIPGDVYINPPSGRLPESLNTSGFRVGISYAGNSAHSLDFIRSIHLRKFAGLSRINGIQLFNLQINGGGSRKWRHEVVDLLQGGEDVDCIDLSDSLTTFSETAMCMAELDLVITIDSSLAHLAGAMGKDVWLILPYAGDWRWFDSDHESPWYPSIRIYRQSTWGDYDSVFQRIESDLRSLASNDADLR